ncbi:MAG: penicillin amidase [Actinomycetota bacterium]|nr:penicillin amidase [Actinomycetota bacterium]
MGVRTSGTCDGRYAASVPSRRVLRRNLIGVTVFLAALLVVATATGVTLVRRPFPVTEGRISLPGLGAEVSVRRDALGVPQIYADTPDDLFRGQGYVHAQDRFFEMDLRRHVSAGRLSELTGQDDDALLSDKIVRTLGWRQVAQAELEQADDATRRHLESYSRGVNDYLRGRSAAQLSVNYSLLGLSHSLPAIEPWTPVDSLAWFKALAWDLRGGQEQEVDRALTYGVVRDVSRVDQLYPAYPFARHTPILPDGGRAGSVRVPNAAPARTPPTKAPAVVPPESAAVAEALRGPANDSLEKVRRALAAVSLSGTASGGIGSNSWVVSGKHTQSGKPFLANDPHLRPSAPGVWYQMGLHCRQVSTECPFDVSGYSFSGVPGIFIGHNARISWGLTNLAPDATDLFLEKVSEDRVERDGQEQALTIRKETIAVAGGPSVTITVRTGPHGPLLSDVAPELEKVGERAPSGQAVHGRYEGYAVAISWTALTPGHGMDAVFALNRASNFDTFRKAVQLMDAPAQSVVYADVDGHIGYQASGRIPLRPRTSAPTGGNKADVVPLDGTWPLPGWTSAHDWKSFVPASQLPWAADPADGLIVAANQVVTPANGTVTLGRGFDYGYRSQRIRDLLSTAASRGTKLTVVDMEAIQKDTQNGMAAELVPLLLQVKMTDSFYADAVKLLDGWNGDQKTDSAAAAYFNAVWSNLLQLTFSDELPEGSRPDGGSRWFEVVRNLLDRRNDTWWDDRRTPSVLETRDEIVSRALVQARNQLTMDIAKDPGVWSWGRLHQLELRGPLGDSPWLAVLNPLLLSSGPRQMAGGSSTVNAMSWDAEDGDFHVVSAPSMRMIVDLGDLNRSRWVNQSGQSGHPGHDHYLDQFETWARGRTHPWAFTPQAVQEATEETLILHPAGGS